MEPSVSISGIVLITYTVQGDVFVSCFDGSGVVAVAVAAQQFKKIKKMKLK